MNAADALGMSLANLGRRKGRAALTLAGVIVGVAALVLMVALGLGLRRAVLSLFQAEDSLRTIAVMRVKSDPGDKESAEGLGALLGLGGQLMPVTEKDLEELRAIPGVRMALPDFNLVLRVTVESPGGGRKNSAFEVGGAAPEERDRYASALVYGGLWKDPEERACLLPTNFVSRLGLSPAQVIGAKVRFRALVGGEEGEAEDEPYTVAGVVESKKFGLLGNRIYLPMNQAAALYEKKGGNPLMPARKGAWLQAEVRVTDPAVAEEVARRLKSAGYTTISASDLTGVVNVIFLILEGVLACIGAIGLLVSLFGIANTMATAVLERTREIGIMKALGARNRDVGRLFLSESAAIGLLGGAIGLAGAFLLGTLLDAVARRAFKLEGDIHLFHFPWWLAAGSVVFSVMVSVMAGWLPARRAARMEPVAALRYE